jgi:hypothetical protein
MNDLGIDSTKLGCAAVTAPRIRWWNSLAFRLAVVINLTAMLVLGGFWVIDYRRERSVHLEGELDRLGEEAGVLQTARSHLPDSDEFQRFVDTFCRQMNKKVSPGHHILAFDRSGGAIIRAHERTDAALETKMADAQRSPVSRFSHRASEYIAVSLPDSLGGKIVVAQSLQPIEQIIHAQAVSRAASLGVLAAVVFGVTTIALMGWVRNPLHELVKGLTAVGRGQWTPAYDRRVLRSFGTSPNV